MGNQQQESVHTRSMVLIVVVIVAILVLASFIAQLHGPAPLSATGGAVGQVNQPPFLSEAIFGYVNVSTRLFNVSVTSMSFGPYALNQILGGNRTVVYIVACFEIDSCAIAFWAINDATIHDYLGSGRSVPVDVGLSNGESVRGNATVQGEPVALAVPNGDMVASKVNYIVSGKTTGSNLPVSIPINDSVKSPITRVTIGDQTVNSSYFTRETYPLYYPNGTMTTIQGPLTVMGPIVYYVMQNAGNSLPVILWFGNGRLANMSLSIQSEVTTFLQH